MIIPYHYEKYKIGGFPPHRFFSIIRHADGFIPSAKTRVYNSITLKPPALFKLSLYWKNIIGIVNKLTIL